MKKMRTKIVCSFLAAVMLLLLLPQAVFSADADEAIVSNDVTMTEGASIRLADDYGIRFEATVSKTLFEAYGNENVQAGMILAPTERIGTSDFTDTALKAGDYIKVPSTGWYGEDANGGKIFRSALVGFPKTREAVRTGICARAYVEVKDAKGNITVFWSPFAVSNARSLLEVALLASQSSAEYADNQTVKDIIALGGEQKLPFTYVQQKPEAYIATMGMNSFRFNESYVAMSEISQKVQVKSNLPISVGQKVEFDYRYIQTSMTQGVTGMAFFWLMDGTKQISESNGKVYSTMEAQYMQTPNMNRCYFGTNTAGPADIFGDGKTMQWDHVNYHITIEILPGTGNVMPQFIYTITETGNNAKYSSTKIVYAEQKEMPNMTLVFASRNLAYEISDLKVSNLEAGKTASLFSYTGNLSAAEKSLVKLGTDSFGYQEGISTYTDHTLRTRAYVRVNLPVQVGQKIEFDYEWKKSSSGNGMNWSEVYFWFDNANTPVSDFWNQEVYSSGWMFYWNGGCDVQRAAFLGKIVPNDGDKVQFTDGMKGGGQNMHWDVKKYHVTVELRAGVNGGNPQFVYTFTENDGRADAASCTIVYTAKTANLTNVTLNFSSLWVAYEISNITVSDLA